MFYKGERMERSGGPGVPGAADFHGFGDHIRKELASRIPSGKRVRILDVGTGAGTNVTFLAGHVSKESEIWTIDPSEEVLSNVRAALGPKASNVRFVRASADRLEFEDGFFDFVTSVMVMHHLTEVRSVIGELARVLKSGGRLLVVDYKPEAGRDLHFQSRHEESDFFAPDAVRSAGEEAGMEPRVRDFGLWYLVDLKK